MKKLVITTLALASTLSFGQAINQSAEKVKVKAPKKVDKADELITNRRFRAQNGGLNPLSVNMNLFL
jgi:hypothetical protein